MLQGEWTSTRLNSVYSRWVLVATTQQVLRPALEVTRDLWTGQVIVYFVRSGRVKSYHARYVLPWNAQAQDQPCQAWNQTGIT